MAATNVRKGDKVLVLAGKEKGKRGKILRTEPKNQRVIVEGLNIIKKAAKPTQKNPQGGIITREGSIHISDVMLVCQSCDQPARLGHRTTDGGDNVRICRRCGQDIDKG